MQLIDLGPKLAKPVMKWIELTERECEREIVCRFLFDRTLVDELISAWKSNHNEANKGSKLFISDSGRLVAFIATLIAVRSGKCALLALL